MSAEVRNRYLLKLDEINSLAIAFTYEFDTVPEPEARRQFYDILLDMYIEGWAAAAYMLGEDIEPAGMLTDERRSEITDKKYDGESIGEKFRKHYDAQDAPALEDLIRSEAHRCYSLGVFKKADASGGMITWRTVGDDRVRDTHWWIDGISVPTGSYFVTFDGDKARFPGDFQKAENNANCRCYVEATKAPTISA